MAHTARTDKTEAWEKTQVFPRSNWSKEEKGVSWHCHFNANNKKLSHFLRKGMRRRDNLPTQFRISSSASCRGKRRVSCLLLQAA